MSVHYKALKYSLLPGIFPRLKALIGSGFVHIALILAYVFASVGLLPRAHPYLNANNIGRYGIRHVIAEAANNLEFSRRRYDQVFIFFTILAGLVLLVLQFALFIVALVTQPVLANQFIEIFQNPSPLYGSRGPSHDLSFMLLDRVFGMQGIFNSCISDTATQCLDMRGNPVPTPANYPFPIHIALHRMFGFYSLAIGVISLAIILYQIVNIVGETATTGTPFGKRFSKAWAPLRLVLFFALLAPLNTSEDGRNAWMNGAQLMTLWTAKWGSNVATNGWAHFQDTLTTNYLGEMEELIAVPNFPDMTYLSQFLTIVQTCAVAHNMTYGHLNDNNYRVGPYLIRTGINTPDSIPSAIPANQVSSDNNAIRVFTKSTTSPVAMFPGFDQAIEFSKGGTIHFRYGISAEDAGVPPEEFPYPGNVKPVCGDIKVPISSGQYTVQNGASSVPALKNALAYNIGRMYYALINENFSANTIIGQPIRAKANCLAAEHIPINGNLDCSTVMSNEELSNFLYKEVEAHKNAYVTPDSLIQDMQDDQVHALPDNMMNMGWAAAAIWYNQIADMNGEVAEAVIRSPQITSYPVLMQEVERFNLASSEGDPGIERFNPGGLITDTADLGGPEEIRIAHAMYDAFRIFEDYDISATSNMRTSNNAIETAIDILFGAQGLFDMRENADINPLAQLSSLGRSLIETAVRNFAGGLTLSFSGQMLRWFTDSNIQLGPFSDFLFTVAIAGMIVGFMLYYLLPFLPFLYFFFALGGWVKGIFEAMVAMPLWALAHLTLEGDGLSGRPAAQGYYLIFEIFLRPILIFAGLVGSILSFSTFVNVLNEIFDLVVNNVGASNDLATPTATDVTFYRGAIDEFFFTMMYAIIVYMTATACFKMIDMVPNSILRWMGITTQTFQETDKNKLDQISGQVYSTTNLTMGQVSSALTGRGLSQAQAVSLAG